jgi:hypothetical protein
VFTRFNENVINLKEYETPIGTGVRIIKFDIEVNKLTRTDQEVYRTDQEVYRTGGGSLLYLVKHLRLFISNFVRDLSKVMNGSDFPHQKMLFRTIFIDKTRNKEKLWHLQMISNGISNEIVTQIMLDMPTLGEI